MKIEEVITQTIIAIYSTPLPSKTLFLKGGSAMRLFDNLTSRLSIDADFSVNTDIDNESKFFRDLKSSVGACFRRKGFDIIDFEWNRKPKKIRAKYPDWWGGWLCEFKLVSFKHRGKLIETKRRNALIPDGANSSKVTVEISKHEYCGRKRTKTIQGVKIFGYSRELLVLEKIRAICQQHPDYAYRSSKNRARDFYDIYELTANADDGFISRCSSQIEKVFRAKEVPLQILASLREVDFIDEQRRGFDAVKDTVIGEIHDFDVYVEHLRFFVKDICPEAV
jgi:predicted nucleotidyltransferase component of viral defense system